jgi:hypothetical protein
MLNTIIFYICIVFIVYLYSYGRVHALLLLYFVLYNSNLEIVFGQHGQFFGLFSLVEVLAFLLILFLSKKHTVESDDLLKKYVNIALYYIIISYSFDLLYYYKGNIMMGGDGSYFIVIKRLMKYTIFMYLFVLISRNYNRLSVYTLIDKAIIIFAIYYSLANILYFPLLSIGIDIAYTNDGATRTSGIFIGGDANTVASVLGMCFGYIVAQIEKKRANIIYYIAIVFIVFGIIETGSRGGLLGLAAILLLYLYLNKSNFQGLLVSIVTSMMIIAIIVNYGDNVLGRFVQHNVNTANMDFDPTKYGGANIRFYKWVIYLKEIASNPDYIFIGNLRPRPAWIRFNAHNVFIIMLYYGGILFFSLYSYVILKMLTIKQSKRPGSYRLVYVLIPFLIMIMELNDWYYFILPFFVMHSYGYIETNKHEQIHYSS